MRFSQTIRFCALAGLLGGISLPAMGADEPADANSPAALFEQLDANKDGKLTKDEVGEDRARFFNRLVRVADKDKDGALSKEEFIAGSQPAERPAQPQPGNPGGQRPQFGGSSEELFKRIDQNGDGKLTKDEIPEPLKERFQPAFERLGKDELTLQDLQRIAPNQFAPDRNRMAEEFFKRADTNGDGKLTLEEAPEQFKPVLQEMLRRKGKDGAITLDDVKQSGLGGPMPPGGFGGGFGGGANFMRLVDVDRDGKISKAELAKAAEQFDKLDQNGDGSLDARELSGFGGRPNPGTPFRPGANRDQPPNVEQSVNGIMERFDADKDGKLSEKEMSELPARNKQRFAEWDADKDGSLTKEEITAGMKKSFDRSPRGSDRPRPARPARPKTDN